jgi:dephospho-CoA kinase
MGCGKSAASRALVRGGFRLLDSDAMVREQVLTSGPILASLVDRYGARVLAPDGTVDRVWLGARVFSEASERKWLEELTHPVLFALWRRALTADPDVDWVFEVPLLFEQRLENWFDFTLCVACSPGQQLVRLEQRGFSRELAGQRISQQLPLARKIELADRVVWNDGSPAFLQVQIDTLVASFPGRR